ncbi:hypothetical protein EYF80_062819 [Liparis tanakae]|uniref:Uncharacterized protein n=1 Tax=Liparis tanakae TaxID=230148 RepID=A0A4Z2EE50_9TELE|nr:hypothetical protein EYF80_062819 [Liparis tanakae]
MDMQMSPERISGVSVPSVVFVSVVFLARTLKPVLKSPSAGRHPAIWVASDYQVALVNPGGGAASGRK